MFSDVIDFCVEKGEKFRKSQKYQIGLLSVISFLRFGHVHVDTQKQQ